MDLSSFQVVEKFDQLPAAKLKLKIATRSSMENEALHSALLVKFEFFNS